MYVRHVYLVLQDKAMFNHNGTAAVCACSLSVHICLFKFDVRCSVCSIFMYTGSAGK